MKLVMAGFSFEGDVSELVEAALLSREVGMKLLKVDPAYFKEMGTGKSYVLQSNQTWDDEDEPGD